MNQNNNLFPTLINAILDSVTNKLRILRGGLPAIEGSAQKQSRESSLEMPNSPP